MQDARTNELDDCMTIFCRTCDTARKADGREHTCKPHRKAARRLGQREPVRYSQSINWLLIAGVVALLAALAGFLYLLGKPEVSNADFRGDVSQYRVFCKSESRQGFSACGSDYASR